MFVTMKLPKAGATIAAAVSALAVTALLAGCTPSSEPTVLPSTEIDWLDSAPADDDPYAAAARAADLGSVLAWNAHDFTITQLTSTVTPELAAAYYENFQPLQRLVFPGPRPSSVISVVENDSGDGAQVVLCRVSKGWQLSSDETRPIADLTAGTETTYTVVTSSAGSLVVSAEQPSGIACDATSAAVGYFEPTPVIPDKLENDDVRPPIGYEG